MFFCLFHLYINFIFLFLKAPSSERGTQGSKPKGKLFFKRNHDLPEVTEVKAFTDVQLSCLVGGSPPPTIHWTYNTKRIQQVIFLNYLLLINFELGGGI